MFERIEPLVLGLGRAAEEGEALHELGRCFHTLKGAAGSVGIGELASLVHALEEHIEGAGTRASQELIDLLHQTLSYLDGLLDWLRSHPCAGPTEPRGATARSIRARLIRDRLHRRRRIES